MQIEVPTTFFENCANLNSLSSSTKDELAFENILKGVVAVMFFDYSKTRILAQP